MCLYDGPEMILDMPLGSPRQRPKRWRFEHETVRLIVQCRAQSLQGFYLFFQRGFQWHQKQQSQQSKVCSSNTIKVKEQTYTKIRVNKTNYE